MDQKCFVLDFSPAMGEGLRRIEVTYRSLVYLIGVVALLFVGLMVLGSTYVQMTWRVSNYNRMAADFERLRNRYQELQRISRQHNEQLASLETLASEVSVAYGLHSATPDKTGSTLVSANPLNPTVKESMAEFNFLKTASYSGMYSRSSSVGQRRALPSLWPMAGIIRSSFGSRSDPFSGEGAFHTGIDLAAPKGTPVDVAGDGVVVSAGWAGGYGKLVVVDHGNGVETYYAHLSRFAVMPGQEIHKGQLIAYSGSTGRSTGPHMHYEVRIHGTPVNPYKYLARADKPGTKQKDVGVPAPNDFGL